MGNRRPRGLRRSRDERGGAVSLWVVLMVPVSAFAAVVALAGPQRLAAESSMQEAADDLAVFTVAWRDGAGRPEGPLPPFPPDCEGVTPALQAGLDAAGEERARLDKVDSGLRDQSWMDASEDVNTRIKEAEDAIAAWREACEFLAESLLRDLGGLGLDAVSLRGFYSDSLKGQPEVPCRTLDGGSGSRVVVHDAVHVAVAADWQHAGWAAAQVWRDGLPMAAESIGRLSQHDQSASPPDECGEQLLQILDSQGRPMWAGDDPTPPSRKLAQSVARTSLSK